MRKLGARKALFCNKCKDLFCKDVYFCLLLCILFCCHSNIYCRGWCLSNLLSEYKTLHKRKEESEERFCGFTIFICNVLSAMMRNP